MGFFKIKKTFLVLLFLILCGCSVKYDIKIEDDTIYENSTITVMNENLNNKSENGLSLEEELNFAFNSLHDVDNGQEEDKTKSFEIKKIKENDFVKLSYKNTFKLDNYSLSPLLKQCYDNVEIINNEEFFTIKTSNIFNCFDYYSYFNNIIITLKSDYNLLNGNYKEYKNGVYYWEFNKLNYDNAMINITLDKSNNIKKTEEKAKFIKKVLLPFAGVTFLIIVVVIFIKFMNSNKK